MTTSILDKSSHLQLAQTLNDLIERDQMLSPASLARKLGIPTNKITRILNGDVTDPKASTLLQIANYFDITIEQLLGLEPINSVEDIQSKENTTSLPTYKFSKLGEQASPREWYRWAENTIDGEYFALDLDTDLYEPIFPNNSILIINRHIEPEDRSYVLLQNKDQPEKISIKKYVFEGNKIYLYPINPKLPIEVYEKNLYTISGVILEVHHKLNNKGKL